MLRSLLGGNGVGAEKRLEVCERFLSYLQVSIVCNYVAARVKRPELGSIKGLYPDPYQLPRVDVGNI